MILCDELRRKLCIGLIWIVIFQVVSSEKRTATVSGEIRFQEEPTSIPDGSLLTVKLQDTSRADDSAINLGTLKKTITGWKLGDSLTYSISVDGGLPRVPEITVRAVLNMGWAAHGPSWVRSRDYLSTSSHRVDVKPNQNDYEKDIYVEQYNWK